MGDNQTNPSYRLSDDIFFIIFKLVESSSTNTRQPVRRKAPFNLALVSKHWRQLALNTPNLWTRIDMVNFHMIPTLIERSKGSPLTVELVGNDPRKVPLRTSESGIQDIRLDQYVEKTLPYIDRWEHL